MAVVLTLAGLADLDPGWQWASSSYGALQLYDQYYYDYATLYRTQPNVRTCVDFLARNIAQLGLHWFRRVSDTDRQRLIDYPAAQLIEHPLPPEFKVTRYRLIEALMGDLGVYFNAYWLKVRTPGRLALLRIPPPLVLAYGYLLPAYYEITVGTRLFKVGPADLVHFRGYNPESAILGLSPLETLRRVLAEEHAMGDYRQGFWQSAARMSGILTRPETTVEWSKAARERFRAEWEGMYSGSAGSGKTAILEDGMTWTQAGFDAQQSEYMGGRELAREECARAYNIPLTMVGILKHATFSNIVEQHKNLYQDCLGPWLAMLEQDIMLQLLPEFEDTKGVYCEFNIAEKLQGSFEDQATALQTAIGRPWMDPNEGRARMNLPSKPGDANELGTPLNVLIGGQASPRDSAPPKGLGTCDHSKAAREGEIDPTQAQLRRRHELKWVRVLRDYFRRQKHALVSHATGKASKAELADVWVDGERWDRELGADLYRLNVATATVWAKHVAETVDAEADPALMEGWLFEHARIAAEEINATSREQVSKALLDMAAIEALRHVFEIAAGGRALEIATSAVNTAANFGAHEGARAGGLRAKTWQVNSANPRPAHAAIDGETVGIKELFSNGMMWPGDPAGGVENNAGCQCSVRFGR